jgi:hypothetical protein
VRYPHGLCRLFREAIKHVPGCNMRSGRLQRITRPPLRRRLFRVSLGRQRTSRLYARRHSMRARVGAFQHVRRREPCLDRARDPLACSGPERVTATGPAEALIGPAGRPGFERPSAPWATRCHGRSSRSRIPGPPHLFAPINLTPACSSARRNADRMAGRGRDTPRSN